jgi:hypothetical protein
MQALDGFRTEISPMLQLVTPGDVYPAP